LDQSVTIEGITTGRYPHKKPKTPSSVIPAKAGIQEEQRVLDPGVRRGDDKRDSCDMIKEGS